MSCLLHSRLRIVQHRFSFVQQTDKRVEPGINKAIVDLLID